MGNIVPKTAIEYFKQERNKHTEPYRPFYDAAIEALEKRSPSAAEKTMRERLIQIITDVLPSIRVIDCFALVDNLLENGVIVLPTLLGTKVYVLGQPCGGCSEFNEPVTEESIKQCQECKKWEIGTCDFDYELIEDFGKLVFLTGEEAEAALNERCGE